MAITTALEQLETKIARAAQDAGRDPSEIRLMPVTKFRSADEVRACMDRGYRMFGENRLQELAHKHAELPDARFVMIGHAQRNKAKLVVDAAAELHSLDSLELAANLDQRLCDAGRTLPVLVQVNTSNEPQKAGIAPSEAERFVEQLLEFEALNVQGLMTMAMPSPNRDEVAGCFRTLREVRDHLREAFPERAWNQLSMGMSGDFELAIAEGSTIVRIGTAIFGPRPAV